VEEGMGDAFVVSPQEKVRDQKLNEEGQREVPLDETVDEGERKTSVRASRLRRWDIL
jgi:hypothetical protein